MTCQQIGLEWAHCLVEIDARPAETGAPAYTAFVSLLEEGGAIVRPLVLSNGRRIELHATTEPLALNSAITFLIRRFGPMHEPERGCALASSAFGPPVVVED